MDMEFKTSADPESILEDTPDLISDLQEKLQAAIEIEDYKTAAVLQKQLDEALLDAESQAIAANTRFYKAFSALDTDAMQDIWHDADYVKCIHPGSQRVQILTGFKAVLDSWEAIFRNSERMSIGASNLRVHIAGRVAIITCSENLSTKTRTGFSATGTASATNIFERHGTRWLMVHHHSS